MSKSIGRSSSVRNPPTQRDFSAPAILTSEAEPYDTALPPMSSKQLVVATRRPQGISYQNLITVQGGLGGHRRTGSTLKTVMRKIFTRNRRSRTDEIDDPISDFHFGSHVSPLSINRQNSPGPSKSGSSIRSNHVQPKQEKLTTLDVVLKQLDTEPRQRRATLPSLILSDDGSRHALDAVLNPGKKPSNGKLSPHANSDPDEMQRRRLRNAKRRSRSAGALRAMSKEHRMSPIQWKRRRSAESEYIASTTHGVASDSELATRPPTRSTVASVSKPSAEVSVFEEDETEDEPSRPPSLPPSLPPNVGELISSMQHDENATLEQRLTTLEVKLIDLEFAIARMQSGQTPTESPNQKNSKNTSDHKRQKSSTHTPTPNNDDSPTTDYLSANERPVSTATIRPSLSEIHRARALQAPSMVSLHSDSGAISVQQYSALVMLLRREQTARRNLEQQVNGLREDIERIHQMARDSIGVGTMYPIRSIESQEYLRLRPDESPSSSPRHTSEKISSRHGSDSDFDRSESRSKDDRFRPWQASRRIEVAPMI
ncbi:hypothetical protein BJY04DRAFT_206055 [Aspergillus karnatakaensis]|uniref:uncharacterized protein n=1 Tax=Aspergillus karnatakaensis TaxID=1810916 RepID=UPI003CCE3063